MRLFSWLLDCRASLAMTGSVQRRPLPVIARRSCAAAIESFSVRRPEEAAFDQCFGHLFLFRRPCAEAIQASGARCAEEKNSKQSSTFVSSGQSRRRFAFLVEAGAIACVLAQAFEQVAQHDASCERGAHRYRRENRRGNAAR